MGERRLDAEEIDHLRQRDRDHREVDALAADRERAGDQPEHGRAGDAGEDRQLGIEPPDLRRVRADIARHAQEHRVAERQQPDIADQQIERAGEQRDAQHLHDEERIGDERRDDDDAATSSANGNRRVARIRVATRALGTATARRSSQATLPNSPEGRMIRTIAMMTKTTVLEASG